MSEYGYQPKGKPGEPPKGGSGVVGNCCGKDSICFRCARAKLEASERAAAAMREAIELLVDELVMHIDRESAALRAASDALYPDAGREFVHKSELESVSKQAAAMREALEAIKAWWIDHYGSLDGWISIEPLTYVSEIFNQSLSSDAGKNYVPLSELETAQKQAAAMREAIESYLRWHESGRLGSPDLILAVHAMREALSSDAGREFVRASELACEQCDQPYNQNAKDSDHWPAFYCGECVGLARSRWCADRDALKLELETAQKQAAAMREALEAIAREVDTEEEDKESDLALVLSLARRALSSDASPGVFEVKRLHEHFEKSTELDQIRAERDALKEELNSMKVERMAIKRGNAQLKEELSAARAERDELKKENMRLKLLLDADSMAKEIWSYEMENKVPQAEEQMLKLWDEMDQLRAERDALLAERKAWRAFEIAAGERKSVSEVLSSRLVAVEAERDALKKENATLAAVNKMLSFECKKVTLFAELSAARAELHDARSECAAAVDLITRLLERKIHIANQESRMAEFLDNRSAIGREYQAKVQRLVEAARQATLHWFSPMISDPTLVDANRAALNGLKDALKEFEK